MVTRKTWGWPVWKSLPLAGLFLVIDLAFFAANSAKFFHGGWVPIVMGAAIFTVMTTWKTGRKHLARGDQVGDLAARHVPRGREAREAAPGARDGGLHGVEPGGHAADPAATT